MILLAFLPFVFLARSVAGQSPDLVQYTIRDSARFESLSASGLESDVRYTLARTDYSGIQGRISIPFWLVGLPNGSITAQVTSAKWVVVSSDGAVQGPYGMEDETDWGTLQPLMTTVRATHQDVFRLVGLYRGELNIANAVTRTVDEKTLAGEAILIEATMKLTLSGQDGTAIDPVRADPYMVRILNELVVNKDQIVASSQLPAESPEAPELLAWNQMLSDAEKAGPLLFARLPRGGIYILNSQILREAGMPTEDIPVDRLRVYAGKDELAVYPANLRGDRLVGNASLYFYVPIDRDDKKPFIPLWVFLGKEGTRQRQASRTVVQSATPTVEGRGTRFVRIFEPNVYSHLQPVTAPQLKWATADVSPGSFEHYEFEARRIQSDFPAKLTYWMIGDNSSASEAAKFQILVNDGKMAEGSVRGTRLETAEVEFPSSALREGVNRLTVYNPESATAESGKTIRFIMAELKLPTSTAGAAPQELMTLQLDEASSTTLLFKRFDPSSRMGVAMDVSEPLNPRVADLRAISQNADFAASFDFDRATPAVIYTGLETALRPEKLSAVKAPTCFLDSRQVDYLAIYYPPLRDALQPLLDYRARTFAVDAVGIDEVYAAFSFGEQRYQAIQQFLRHAYLHRKAPRLSKVLLVGEGSEYWWEYRRNATGVSRNMIPVYGWQDPNVRIRGDESYAQLFGEPIIADLELSRISVNDSEELKNIVEKTVAYEDNPPVGDWRNRNVFVTDDEPEFIRVAKAVIEKTVAGPVIPRLLPLQDYPYENYFRGVWRKRSVEFTDVVIDEMNRGALTVTYLGHGGPNLWSGERILHIRDIDRLVDGGRHAFLLAGSCDTGWVDYPIDPVKTSLSEHFLRRPGGGSIGAFIPIDGTSSYNHDFLLSGFFHHLFRGKIRDVGTLTLLSKIDFYLDRNDSSVTNQYLLMGDPAVVLPPQPGPLDIKVSPDKLLTVTGRQLNLSGQLDRQIPGLLKVTLLSPTSEIVREDRFPITAGRISAVFPIPGYLEKGVYTLVAEANNEEERKSLVASVPITVFETRLRLSWDTTPSSDQLIEASRPVSISFEVFNDSDIDLVDAELVIRDKERKKEVMRTMVTAPAHGSAKPTFERALPEGVTVLEGRLQASAPELNRETIILAESTLLLRAKSDKVRYLDFPLDAIEVRRALGSTDSHFRMPVYNMSDVTLPPVVASLKRITETTSIPIAKDIGIEPLKTGDHIVLDFLVTENLPEQATDFMLELYDISKEKRRLLQLTPFTYQMKAGPDLQIVPGDFFFENEHIFVGRTVYARFKVRNIGDAPAENVSGRLYIGEPWVEQNAAPTSISWFAPEIVPILYPGDEKTFRIRWDPKGTSHETLQLFATVQAGGGLPERNMANNQLMKPVSLLSPPNLRLVKERASIGRPVLRPHEAVTIKAPFENNSVEDFVRDFRLSVYATRQDGVRRRIYTRRYENLGAGDSGDVQFDWVVQPGEYAVEMSLNEDREYLEDTHDDNVLSFKLPYIMDADNFGTSHVWDFSEFPDFGSLQSIIRDPSGALSISARPSALRQRCTFDASNLIKGQLGDINENDNLWGLQEGRLYLTFGESGPPVKFRIPLDSVKVTRTYDVYIDHIGNYVPEKMSGDFKYRIEDQRDWTLETRPDVGVIYMGRFDVRDDYLDIEFAAPDYPSENLIYSVLASPVLGIYESPIVEYRRAPTGRLLVDETLREDSRINFAIRQGHGREGSIEWREWRAAAAGVALPVADPSDTFLQWRATMVQGGDQPPLLRSVRIEETEGAFEALTVNPDTTVIDGAGKEPAPEVRPSDRREKSRRGQ